MFIRTASFCSLLMVLSAGLGATAQDLDALLERAKPNSTTPLHLVAEGNEDSSLPHLVAQRIKKDLSSRVNVPVEELRIYEATRRVWPDACLGVTNLDEVCAQRNVRGWEVAVDSSNGLWRYRSDRAAERLSLVTGETESAQWDFSAAIAQKVMATASQQLQIPTADLRISSVQSAVWDGCLGITKPNQACTKNIVPGFKVLVSRQTEAQNDSVKATQRKWLYHASADGSRILQNTDAIHAERLSDVGLLRPTVAPSDLKSEIFVLTQNHIAGIVGVTTLAADGTVYYETIAEMPEQSIPKQAVYQLSAAAVAEFESLLTQQRFSNFDRVFYFNEDPNRPLHDGSSGSLQLAAAGGIVGFNSEEKLPPLLQPIVSTVMEIDRKRIADFKEIWRQSSD